MSKYTAHTEKIFKALKLLKVNDILKLQELNFYCKYKNETLLITLQVYLSKIILSSIFMQQEYNTKFIYSDLIMNIQKGV